MTLQAQLVTSIVTLFAIVTMLIGTLVVAQLHTNQVNQIDNQLASTKVTLTGPGGDGDRGGGGGGGLGPGGGSGVGDTLHVDLSTDGSVLKYQPDPTSSTKYPSAYVNRAGKTIYLTSSQIATLKSAGLGSTPKNIDLGGNIGEYRLIALQRTALLRNDTTGISTQSTVTTIIGQSMKQTYAIDRRTTLSVALFSLAGLIVVGLATSYVVRRATNPLRRVAATATRVSQLPLSAGEVVMHERVPEKDTDRHTEVGQVGAALNDMLDHVDHALNRRQESETQVRRFVADASHELRTPLASIRGYAELSRRETEPVPSSVTHALGRIESEAGRMTTLVEDMLLLARLDAGRPLEREPVDLTMLVIETVSDLHAAGPDHVWNLDLPDEAIEVVGDGARLRQVLINLLANSRKHTPAGTTVTTGLRRAGENVLVTVSDNGPGIDPELVPKIFERFTRGDQARVRSEGSTGLGLSIVSAVVAAHHGRVDVTSKPGNNTFTITLPATAPATGAQS